MLGHRLRTSGSELEHSIWASRGGSLQRERMALPIRAETKRAGEDYGKDAPWKSPSDFPTSRGNPTFPQSRRRCSLNLKPDISCAQKSGHFNLLRTSRVKIGVVSTRCVRS